MEAGQLSLDFDSISEGEKRVITGPATKQLHQNCHCIILKASIKSKTRSLANCYWTTLKQWQCDIWHNWLAENISTEPLINQKHITRLLFLVKGHWTHDRFLSWQKSASRVSSVQTHHKVIVFGEGALDSRSVSVMTEVSISCLLCAWAFLRLVSMMMRRAVMSAGLTPPTLLAWPMVCGLTWKLHLTSHIFKEFQKKKLCLAVGIYRTISNKSVISILTLIGTTKRISL
jgi:hypothetical protein